MRAEKSRIFVALSLCLAFTAIFGIRTVFSQQNVASSKQQKKNSESEDGELKAIRQTLTDYIQGSTNGQPSRLKKAFHPKLNLYSTRNGKLRVWTGSDYIKSTKEGVPTGEQGKILAIEYEHDIAVAKVEIAPPKSSRPYIDYFMLLKIESKWTIVHKMYTRSNGKSGANGRWKLKKDSAESKDSKTPKKQNFSQKVSAESVRKIDSVFSDFDRQDSPGSAVCVIKDGQVVFKKGYGSANLEHKIPIDPEKSVFNIGSASKQFTAFAALLLAEEGKLSFDDSVRKYLPELPECTRGITIGHLAHHTSGLRSELSLLALAGWTPGDVIKHHHIFRMLCRQKA